MPAFVRLNKDSSKERNFSFTPIADESGTRPLLQAKRSPSKEMLICFLVRATCSNRNLLSAMSCPETRLVFKSKVFAPRRSTDCLSVGGTSTTARRIQSVRLQSKDGSRSFPVLEPTALPAYYEKNELGKTYSFDIPGELVKAESFDCLIELVQGPNAVISEAWLVELPD